MKMTAYNVLDQAVKSSEKHGWVCLTLGNVNETGCAIGHIHQGLYDVLRSQHRSTSFMSHSTRATARRYPDSIIEMFYNRRIAKSLTTALREVARQCRFAGASAPYDECSEYELGYLQDLITKFNDDGFRAKYSPKVMHKILEDARDACANQ